MVKYFCKGKQTVILVSFLHCTVQALFTDQGQPCQAGQGCSAGQLGQPGQTGTALSGLSGKSKNQALEMRINVWETQTNQSLFW